MRHFIGSFLITFIGLIVAYLWGGFMGLTLTLLLCALEISLSFDNAILNAAILQKMDSVWQQRFLTWGILIAVFVVRMLLPIVIVAIVSHLNMAEVLYLIFYDSKQYSKHLMEAHSAISAFGGMFLLLVFLSFLFNQQRTVHWFKKIELKFIHLGMLASVEILSALLILLIIQYFTPPSEKLTVMLAGTVGIVLWIVLHSITTFISQAKQLENAPSKKLGFINFCYLEVLDATFSFDGVISAFAITKDIVIILLGLTIGAVFVRSLTIFFVQKQTLTRYLFLEHGAHYAIGALAILMLASIFTYVPEVIIGLMGFMFIGLSLISSIRYNSR